MGQSITHHPMSPTTILILSRHLRLDISSGLFNCRVPKLLIRKIYEYHVK
jgi:hypothetical protein